MIMFSSSRLAVLQVDRKTEYPARSCNDAGNGPFLQAHLPWNSRLSSLQPLMETSAESECFFIISTTLTWRPLDSSKGRILPVNTANLRSALLGGLKPLFLVKCFGHRDDSEINNQGHFRPRR